MLTKLLSALTDVYLVNFKQFYIKGNKDVFSSDSPFIEWFVQFTNVPEISIIFSLIVDYSLPT